MKKEKKKHGVLRKIGKFFLILLIIAVLFVVGFVTYSTIKYGWGWKGLVKTAVGAEVQTPEELEEFQVLILGVSEDISVALTDTIIVASYNPSTQKATLISIPRDTFVGDSKTRANSYDKINAIFQKDGAEGVIKKVNKLTGLKLKKYLVISNNALVELVDEIGGVEFNVPMKMDYDSRRQNLHIHLKKGVQVLDGEAAEGLVRFRKNNNYTTYSAEYGNDDFGRMRTQREFLQAVAKQTLQAKNVTKIGSLIDIVKRNVKTNIKDWDEIKEYIPYAIDFNTKNIAMESIPGESTRIPARTGLWFFLADETKTLKLVKKLYTKQNSTDEELAAKNATNSSNTTNTTNTTSTNTSTTNSSKIKVELLNGSGDKSKLTAATNSLKKQGYNVYKTGTTSTTQTTTIINRTNVSDDVTSDIKSLLGTGVVSSSNKSSNVDVTVIIGKDYKN